MNNVLWSTRLQMDNVGRDRGGIQYHGKSVLDPSMQIEKQQCCELVRPPIATSGCGCVNGGSGSSH